jgi:hypothetical protein
MFVLVAVAMLFLWAATPSWKGVVMSLVARSAAVEEPVETANRRVQSPCGAAMSSDACGTPNLLVEVEPNGWLVSSVVLVVVVVAELAFVFAAARWAGLTVGQGLHAALGATAIGATAVHGRPIVLVIGHRILGRDNLRGGL